MPQNRFDWGAPPPSPVPVLSSSFVQSVQLAAECKHSASGHLSYHNNNALNSSQDKVGGPQKGEIEEGASKIRERRC